VVSEQVGLVGCGLMGAPIASRLVEDGYRVVVYDKSAEAMARAARIGCTTVAAPSEVGRRARVVLISLPRPEHVTEVVRTGDDCLLAGVQEGSVIVDTSTVDPATSQRNAEAARVLGVGYLDCPILGRPSGCGRWTLPAGGDAENLEAAKPILEAFAARIVHVGPSGHGNMLKLLNNLIFGAINTVTGEVFALGERLGIDPGLLFDTISESGAATVSNLFRELGPKIVERDFIPNFTVDNLEKDVGLGLSMARQAGMTLEFSEAGQRINRAAQKAGLGEDDTAGVVRVFEAQKPARERER
jgi:3-hydroxyisobutyrate dehydrogenase-like beta-hydroxyacid dehydrogenase